MAKYSVCSKSYTISSEYSVSFQKNETYSFTNDGKIVISGLFDEDKVMFGINNEQHSVDGDTIDIAATDAIPQGASTIAIFVNGKEIESVNVNKDTVNPTFKTNLDEISLSSDWIKAVPEIQINGITDETSGIHSVIVYRNNTAIKTYNDDISDIVLSDSDFINGKNEIKVIVTDDAGNAEICSFTAYKDSLIPEFNKDNFNNVNDKWFNDDSLDATLDLGIKFEEENASPIKKVEYYEMLPDSAEIGADATEIKPNDDGNYIVSFNELLKGVQEGKHTFEFYAVDEAGNEAKQTLTVGYDSTLPTLEVDYKEYDQWINVVSDQAVIVNASDVTSGIKEIRYYINDAYDEAKEVKDGKIMLSDLGLTDGIYELYVYAVDNAGNRITSESAKIKIDRDEPAVESFEFKEVDNSSVSQILNALTFGKFFRHGLRVTVYVKDDLSGIREDAVLSATPVGGSESYTYSGKYNSANGAYVFEIPEKDFAQFSNINKVFLGTISVSIADNAGNEVPVAATDKNSSSSISEIMWEQNKPSCSISVDSSNSFEVQSDDNQKDSEYWYDAPDFTVSLNDADSGIKTYIIKVNNTTVKEYDAQEIQELITADDFSVNVSAEEIQDYIDDGVLTVEVEVCDAAGNTQTAAKTFHLDSDAPVISSIKFNDTDAALIDEASETYKYFFDADTVVKVIADDDGLNDENRIPSSGISKIILKVVPVDGEEYETEAACNQDNEATFTVKAGFKGDIYAKAVDNVNNLSDFISPDKIIVETQDMHNQTEHIAIDMTPDDYKENTYFNHTVSPVITVTDEFAGISDVSIVVTGDSIAEGTYDDIINVSDDVSGWTEVSNDKNLVTSLSKTLNITENCSNITINVVMHDNCGNMSEAVYKYNVDTTSPKVTDIICRGDDDGMQYGNFWYNKNVTISAEIEERDIQSVVWHVKRKNADGDYEDYEIQSYSLFESFAPESSNGDDKKWALDYKFTEDGDYKASFTVIDKAGNSVDSKEITFGIDKTAPVVNSVVIDGKTISEASEYITSKNGVLIFDKSAEVEVKLEDVFPGCGLADSLKYELDYSDSGETKTGSVAVENGTAGIVLPENFRGSLLLQPMDKLGNFSDINVLCLVSQSQEEHAQSDGIIIDSEVENNAFSNKDVTINVSAQDAAGIAKIEWNITDGVNTAISGVVSNLSSSESYGWTLEEPEDITLSSDNYKLQVYTKVTRSFTLSDNANDIAATFTITDFAGNKSTSVYVCSIDKTAPVIDIIHPEADYVKPLDDGAMDYYGSAVTLTLNAIERNFTNFDISVTKDGAEYSEYSKTEDIVEKDEGGISDAMSTTSSVTFADDGKYMVVLKVKDRANNESECSYQFVIDSTAPTISEVCFSREDQSVLDNLLKIFSFGIFSNVDVKIEITAADYLNSATENAVGIEKYVVYFGEKIYESDSNVITIPHLDDDEFIHSVYVEVVDILGNTTDKVVPAKGIISNSNAVADSDNTVKLLIEDNPPSVDIAVNEDNTVKYIQDGNIWYSGDVDISVNVDDLEEGSGLESVSVEVNGKELASFKVSQEDIAGTYEKEFTVNTKDAPSKESGRYDVVVKAVDNAGNDSDASYTFFIDRNAPVVESINITGDGDSSFSEKWNLLSFGTFFNNGIVVEVKANDNGPSTGIAKYTLDIGDKYHDENATGVFTVPYDYYDTQETIVVSATDNIQHQSETVSPTDVESNAKNDSVMLEKNEPVINLSLNSDESVVRYDSDDNMIWYSGDIDFDIDVEDKDSGIRSVIADINGTEVINKDYTKEEKTKKVHDKLTVNTDAVEKENESNDGLYRLTVTVFDNAGNSSTITQDIYKDNKRPVIENITFSAGKEENSKWDDLLNLLTFGIFFNDDVKITVDGYDPDVSAGIKEYNLFVGGKLYASTDDGVFNISYDAYNEALASSNRGSAKLSFNIVDNVNNTCDQVIPSVDTSNAKSPVLVLEKEAPYSYVAIPFSSNDEANYFYDEVNNRHWYSGDITSIITAADAESGIRNITATINGTEVLNENYYDRDSAVKEQDVTINTSAGKPDYTGAYELKAVVTDNAGNVSEESVRTVYIDKTSPIITSMLFTGREATNSHRLQSLE